MRIIVAGAGVIGYQIIKVLVENKHDVVVIDINRDVCETIYAETGAMSIHGSATDIRLLEKAGAAKTDTILCLIRNDADNLACTVLAKSLGIPNIIALVRKPHYEQAYKSAGVTGVVRLTDLLIHQLIIEIEQPQVKKIMILGDGKAEIFSVTIPANAKSIGSTIQQIARNKKFPQECVFIGIFEEDTDQFLIPKGDHHFKEGDTIFLVSKTHHIKQVTDFLIKK